MPNINYFAVIVAALSAFLLGGLWYSPLLFLNAWLKEAGAPPQKRHPASVFVLSFFLALIAAACLSIALGTNYTLSRSLIVSALVGVGFVATSYGINYSFAQKSLKLYLIDAGYHVLKFLLFGLILGLWH